MLIAKNNIEYRVLKKRAQRKGNKRIHESGVGHSYFLKKKKDFIETQAKPLFQTLRSIAKGKKKKSCFLMRERLTVRPQPYLGGDLILSQKIIPPL